MDAPELPPAPDPVATAKAQAQANKETAITQYGLNATNQKTPYGNLTYQQVGTWPDGTPRYEATTTLSQGEQGIYDTGVGARQNFADIAKNQSGAIRDILSKPLDLARATEDKIVALGSQRLDPRFARESEALESSLINRGIRPGSKAYETMRMQFDQGKNDAYNQLYLTGRGQSAQEAIAERNQPINEITALMSGSQVSNPNFVNTPSPGVAPTDVIGANQQALNQQNVAYQGQIAQNQALMGGLSGLLGNAAGFAGWKLSDIDTKENIEVVGERPDGLHVIDFDYKPEFGQTEERQRGFIAQEVAQVYPHAVGRVPAKGNRMAVDYSKVPGGSLMDLGSYARGAA